MKMSKIDLKSYLFRKRKTLESFIVDQKIESYEQLTDYCKRRECLPISIEEFKNLLPKKDLQVKDDNVELTLTPSKESINVESTDEKSKNEKRLRKRTKSNFLSITSENEENGSSD